MTHGAGGYSKYGCRCTVCTAAHRSRMREYRKRRMSSEPVATTPGTTEIAPASAGTDRGRGTEGPNPPMHFAQYPARSGGA